MASSFRDLVAYRLAGELAAEVRCLVVQWPSFDRWSIGIQLVRAVDSVGANIAESGGRWHEPDKRRLLVIARGSLYETEHWLLRAQECGLIDGTWQPRVDELARALNGLVKKAAPR